MRVFYNNLLETSTDIAMTNLDNDSYVSNIYHPYLELACFCLASSSTITGTWTDPQEIDSISIAYHNCDFCRVKLYDDNDNELLNENIALEEYDNVYYLTLSITGVYRFSMEYSGGSNIYVGFAYLGKYVELPNADIEPEMALDLRSNKNISISGQTYGSYARQLKKFKYNWNLITNAERQLFIDYVTFVQTCKPHMIDRYYLAHSQEPPCYVTIESSLETPKRGEGGFYYETSIEYVEAR